MNIKQIEKYLVKKASIKEAGFKNKILNSLRKFLDYSIYGSSAGKINSKIYDTIVKPSEDVKDAFNIYSMLSPSNKEIANNFGKGIKILKTIFGDKSKGDLDALKQKILAQKLMLGGETAAATGISGFGLSKLLSNNDIKTEDINTSAKLALSRK